MPRNRAAKLRAAPTTFMHAIVDVARAARGG